MTGEYRLSEGRGPQTVLVTYLGSPPDTAGPLERFDNHEPPLSEDRQVHRLLVALAQVPHEGQCD
jgi:hypothetical protein